MHAVLPAITAVAFMTLVSNQDHVASTVFPSTLLDVYRKVRIRRHMLSEECPPEFCSYVSQMADVYACCCIGSRRLSTPLGNALRVTEGGMDVSLPLHSEKFTSTGLETDVGYDRSGQN